MSKTLWLPAAATSRARFTFSWPKTSLKSGMGLVSCSGSHRGQSLRQGGFSGIVRRDEEGADAGVPGGQGHGQHAGDGPDFPVQAQLSQKGTVRRGPANLPGCTEDAQENGKIVVGSRLFQIGRGQVDGNAADGKFQT